MTTTISRDDRRRARRRRYALPLSILALTACGAFYFLDGIALPPAVPLLGVAIGIAGGIAPMVADDWAPRRSILSNLWAWAVVVAIGTWFMSLRAPDAQGALLAVPMVLAILAGWPLAALHRRRDAFRRRQAREERRRRKAVSSSTPTA